MTVRVPLLAFLLVASVGVFAVALRAHGLTRARDEQASESVSLARIDADLRELNELRKQREVVAAAKRPTQDVIAQVNAILRDAGVPTDRLKNLEPEADAPIAGRYRLQTIRVSLDRLQLRDVGSVLAAWRAAKSVWTPLSIELTHVTGPDVGDQGFDTRIVVGATYLSDVTSEPAR